MLAAGITMKVFLFNETGWGSVFLLTRLSGKDSALEVLQNIYTELIGLFPYKYVHIGGDEVGKNQLKKCPTVRNVCMTII